MRGAIRGRHRHARAWRCVIVSCDVRVWSSRESEVCASRCTHIWSSNVQRAPGRRRSWDVSVYQSTLYTFIDKKKTYRPRAVRLFARRPDSGQASPLSCCSTSVERKSRFPLHDPLTPHPLLFITEPTYIMRFHSPRGRVRHTRFIIKICCSSAGCRLVGCIAPR